MAGLMIVLLPQECGLDCVEAIRADLVAAWGTEEDLVIDVSQVREVDIAAIQLLESVRRTAVKSGRPLQLRGMAASALPKALERGGFTDPARGDHSSFWLSEGAAQ